MLEGQVLITTAVTAVTAGAGSAAGGFISSSIGGFPVGAGVGSGTATGISGFASNLVIGMINNGGNIGKGLKESTSKQALRSLGKNMLAAGVTTGVM